MKQSRSNGQYHWIMSPVWTSKSPFSTVRRPPIITDVIVSPQCAWAHPNVLAYPTVTKSNRLGTVFLKLITIGSSVEGLR